MTLPLITAQHLAIREYWVEEIQKLSGNFGNDSERLESELETELAKSQTDGLVAHLRLCGDIPEQYGHDSSEEKLYSKYTDALLSISFKSLGLISIVLKERADAADVETFAKNFSFVSDAKAFRLSRTAKNQKDFKVQAMDGWKRGKPYAMVVCPIYQLPNKSSQIYEQASTRNVCIFTYSHLALLVRFAESNHEAAEELLHLVFKTVETLNPSKDATSYWLAVNRTILGFSESLKPLWAAEKIAASEAIAGAKEIALKFLANEREKIMRMSHNDALAELLRAHRIDSRIQTIRNVCDNNLMGLY